MYEITVDVIYMQFCPLLGFLRCCDYQNFVFHEIGQFQVFQCQTQGGTQRNSLQIPRNWRVAIDTDSIQCSRIQDDVYVM